ncbi:hypothetical protein ACJX0J_015551, partial [Zea mays]
MSVSLLVKNIFQMIVWVIEIITQIHTEDELEFLRVYIHIWKMGNAVNYYYYFACLYILGVLLIIDLLSDLPSTDRLGLLGNFRFLIDDDV